MEQFITGAPAMLMTSEPNRLSIPYGPFGWTLTQDPISHTLIWKMQLTGYEISLLTIAYLILLLFVLVQVYTFIGDLKKLSPGRRGNQLRKR